VVSLASVEISSTTLARQARTIALRGGARDPMDHGTRRTFGAHRVQDYGLRGGAPDRRSGGRRLDVPPGQAALPRTRLRVTGWAIAVPACGERRVAQAAAAARPLGAHLEAHHGDALVGWVLRTLPLEVPREVREVTVVGVERHGLDVLTPVGASTTLLRAAFDAPVTGEADLQPALCRLSGCPCGRHDPLVAAHR